MTNDSDSIDRETRDKILEIIDQMEASVLEEDKMGATRDMVVEGTCERIREEIHSLPTEPGQVHDCARDPGEIGGPTRASDTDERTQEPVIEQEDSR